MKIVSRNTVKILLITSIAASLLNCSSNRLQPDNVKASDNETVSYDVKLAVQPSDSRIGFVAESQRTSGQDDQYFPDTVYYPSPTAPHQIRPATTTHDDFSVMANSIGLKWSVLKGKHIGINMYFHAMNVDAKVDIEQADGREVQLTESDSGIAPQFELYVPLNEKFRVVGSISNLLHNDVEFETASLALECLVNKNIAVNIGYKKWIYDYSAPTKTGAINVPGELNFNDSSDIQLQSQGVSVGVAFSF